MEGNIKVTKDVNETEVNASVYEEGNLKIEKLTHNEVVFVIVGCGIGSGALGTAYGARLGGFPIIAFWLIVSGILTLASMYYVAESTLRTRTMMQLPGLAEKYVGPIGRILVFLAVVINSLSCLIAYVNGSGDTIAALTGIPRIVSILIFVLPAALVTYKGLKAVGKITTHMTVIMIGTIVVLTVASILSKDAHWVRLGRQNWTYAIPMFNIAAFSYIGQYLVPDLARGSAHNPKQLAPAMLKGQIIVMILLIMVPLGTFLVADPQDFAQVATITWGQAIGQWAFFTANLFALLGMFTSFLPITQTLISNVVDFFKFDSDVNPKVRIPIMLVGIGVPFFLGATKMVTFIDALYFSGTFAAAIMAILPVFMINSARKNGEIEPVWNCGKWASLPVQAIILIMYGGTALYAILGALGFLPAGW